ncbi:MAG: hypothetical protein QM723_08950 [Myxococcaceae bacterium]
MSADGAAKRLLAVALLLGGCITTRPDSVGGGDARLDENTKPDKTVVEKGESNCGPDSKGDLVLLDARTSGPLTCTQVALSYEPTSCKLGDECPSTPLWSGRTNARGQVALNTKIAEVRLVAVADGFSASYLQPATLPASRIVELEMAPEEGFWLKVLDPDGNYLQNIQVSFKQGDDVVASLRTNDLANVFFSQRNPFGGQPTVASADGYKAVTINSVTDLGDDGHTLVLAK